MVEVIKELPKIKMSEITDKYGITETGIHFKHEVHGMVTVCFSSQVSSGVGLGKVDPENPNSLTVQLVAELEFEKQ